MELLSKFETEDVSQLLEDRHTPLWEPWNKFIAIMRLAGNSEITLQNTKNALRFVIFQLNIVSIEDCNNNGLLEDKLFQMKQTRHWSGTTFNTYIKNINTYFIWLKKRNYIEENNLKKITKCREKHTEKTFLTTKDLASMLGYITLHYKGHLLRSRNILILQIAAFTGARTCELLDLNCSDIQKTQTGYKLTIQGRKQKGKPRPYILPKNIEFTLLDYFRHRYKIGRKDEALFISNSKQKRLTKRGLYNFLGKLSTKVGKQLNIYGFRRHTATSLYQAGMDIHKIAEYLGHTRITTTKKYIVNTDETNVEGCTMMEKILNIPSNDSHPSPNR